MNKEYYKDKLKKHRLNCSMKKEKSLGDILIEGNILMNLRKICDCKNSYETSNYNYYCPDCETFMSFNKK